MKEKLIDDHSFSDNLRYRIVSYYVSFDFIVQEEFVFRRVYIDIVLRINHLERFILYCIVCFPPTTTQSDPSGRLGGETKTI